ncbi:DNA-binding protein WhiA [Ihubacter sp. mB4P-1]|uniref:DNA-binding protein WhiA n=1 Tax=Ihubacter sp. mB4P-1 TaxID=3242370 RepID=UPI003C7CA644
MADVFCRSREKFRGKDQGKLSFSTETKNELSRIEPERKCCQLAEIAGFLRVSGSLRLSGGGKFKIVITTDNPAVARHYKKLIKEYFQVETELEVGEIQGPKKGRAYLLTIGPEMRSEQILRETGILLVREGNNYISDGIYGDLIKTKCCRKAYLRGIFMGSGTVSDPAKSYHLEFVCASRNLAADLRKMINTFVDLSAKIVERKDKYIVYMKSSEYICDTLAIMGAHIQMLEYENVKVQKNMVNKAVRMTNCDTANTDRTLDASQRQIENIKRIQEAGGFASLPEKLKEAATLRMQYPEASLVQLGEMMNPPLKKSGINNRFRKIEEIASKL